MELIKCPRLAFLLIGVLVNFNQVNRLSAKDYEPYTTESRYSKETADGTEFYEDYRISQGTSDIGVIIPHCRGASCFRPKESAGSGVPLNRRMRKFLSGGPAQFLWDKILDHNLLGNVNVSFECIKSMNRVQNGLKDGREWAFRFLDASAKTPTSMLESTMVSYGDYDECLEIEVDTFDGMYCTVDMFAVGHPLYQRQHEKGKLNLHDNIVFKSTPYFFGLCLPSRCSQADVRQLAMAAVHELPLQVSGLVVCDTRDSVSYLVRLKNLTVQQMVAATLITSFVGLVLFATANHALNYKEPSTEFMRGMSIFHNGLALVTVDQSSVRQGPVDMFKLVATIAAAVSHYIACLEVPLGIMVLSRQTFLQKVFEQPHLQPMFNESGLGMLLFVSGYYTFKMAYPVAVSKKLPYLWAFVDRFLRHFPATAAVVALDFLWPALFSGPMYTRVGDFILDKCSRNWLYSVTFLSPLLSPLDMCSAHTYTSAVDVQLFATGLVILYIYTKKPVIGDLLCIVAIVSNLYILGHMSFVNNVTPSLFTATNPTGQKTVDYLETTHMKTYVYVPAYFGGFLLARATGSGFKLNLSSNFRKLFWCGVTFVLFQIGLYSHSVHNSFNLIPEEYFYVYIVGLKILFHISAALFIFVVHSFEQSSNESPKVESPAKLELWHLEGLAYWAFKVATRLAFSVYMSNYLFIRTDFFTSRVPYPNLWPNFIKRTVTALTILAAHSTCFYLVFVAPFEHIRRTLLAPKGSKEKSS
ncbi:hypothetical protein HDE_07518 [Halotydeus destructor]|nr:hypothetical protein HDE_07518 [Halotydeus destructor]